MAINYVPQILAMLSPLTSSSQMINMGLGKVQSAAQDQKTNGKSTFQTQAIVTPKLVFIHAPACMLEAINTWMWVLHAKNHARCSQYICFINLHMDPIKPLPSPHGMRSAERIQFVVRILYHYCSSGIRWSHNAPPGTE